LRVFLTFLSLSAESGFRGSNLGPHFLGLLTHTRPNAAPSFRQQSITLTLRLHRLLSFCYEAFGVSTITLNSTSLLTLSLEENILAAQTIGFPQSKLGSAWSTSGGLKLSCLSYQGPPSIWAVFPRLLQRGTLHIPFGPLREFSVGRKIMLARGSWLYHLDCSGLLYQGPLP